MLVSKRSRVRYDDLVLRCCVMLSYSVLIFSTTAAIPHRCRRSFHRHRHPRRTATAAAATAAAAAVRRLLLRSCGWCLLCLFLKKKKKKAVLCDDDRGDRARPICCATINLAGPSPPPPPPPPPPLLRCCYCCAAAVLTRSRPCSKSVLRSLLRETDACVCGFCTHDRMARFCALCFCGMFIANSAKCITE